MNCYGYIVGFIAKQITSLQPNVTFNMHMGLEELITVQGFNYLLTHGHQIKGWAGIPYYGVERKVAKESVARMQLPNSRFRKMLIGHFHTPVEAPQYIINGSLTGTTEFDHGCGRYGPPCQRAFYVHPKYAELDHNVFYLT